LGRSTLADWVGACRRLLAPLAEGLRRHVLSAENLHADDTPVGPRCETIVQTPSAVWLADAYAGFDQTYQVGSVREAARWAHVRRRFYSLQVAHKSAVAKKCFVVSEPIDGKPNL
jgi:hypothetical protein